MKKIIVALLLIAAVMGISSCNLIGGIFAPAYAGTWELVETDYKMTMTLEKEAWDMVYQIKDADDAWADYGAYKGTLEVEGDSMTSTITHEKEATIDYSTGTLVISVLPDEWTAVTGEDAVPTTDTWLVEGETLTLTDSDGESTDYTKVE